MTDLSQQLSIEQSDIGRLQVDCIHYADKAFGHHRRVDDLSNGKPTPVINLALTPRLVSQNDLDPLEERDLFSDSLGQRQSAEIGLKTESISDDIKESH